jgi:hypothetical protein
MVKGGKPKANGRRGKGEGGNGKGKREEGRREKGEKESIKAKEKGKRKGNCHTVFSVGYLPADRTRWRV